MSVRDIQAIRLQNLTFLLQECEAELGQARGAAALLSAKTGVTKSLISMLAGKKLHSETGKRRHIGDDTATKLELGMDKSPGWLDIDRAAAKDYLEAAHLDKLRKLTPSQREAVERMMGELAQSNKPAPAPQDAA